MGVRGVLMLAVITLVKPISQATSFVCVFVCFPDNFLCKGLPEQYYLYAALISCKPITLAAGAVGINSPPAMAGTT